MMTILKKTRSSLPFLTITNHSFVLLPGQDRQNGHRHREAWLKQWLLTELEIGSEIFSSRNFSCDI